MLSALHSRWHESDSTVLPHTKCICVAVKCSRLFMLIFNVTMYPLSIFFLLSYYLFTPLFIRLKVAEFWASLLLSLTKVSSFLIEAIVGRFLSRSNKVVGSQAEDRNDLPSIYVLFCLGKKTHFDYLQGYYP